MSNPTLGTAHINTALTGISIGYAASQPSLARRVFPIVDVKKQTDSYFVWDRGDMISSRALVRAPGTKPAEKNFRLSNSAYTCLEYAIRSRLTKELTANADIELETPIAEGLMRDIMIRESVDFASAFLTTSVWGTDDALAADTRWDAAGSTPIANIRTAARTIKQATGGYKPNVCVLGDQVADVLVEHADVRGRMPVTAMQNVSADSREQFLSGLLGMKVVIADEAYNTAAEGATVSTSYVVSDVCLIAYVAPSPAMTNPSAGYIFRWAEFDGGMATRRYEAPDPGEKSAFIECNSYLDMVATAASAGYFFSNCLV